MSAVEANGWVVGLEGGSLYTLLFSLCSCLLASAAASTRLSPRTEPAKEGAAPRLETLYLYGNQIGDEGCMALNAALKEGAAPSLKARETHPQYKSPWRQPSLTPLTHAYCRGSR